MSQITRGRTAACKDTFGGVKNVYLWAWTSYPFFQIRGVKSGNLTSYPTTTVYQFETVSNTNTYEESLIDDNAYDQSLTVDLKKIDAETTLDLDNYQDIRLGVIVEDYNGFFRLMGAYNGCDLESLKVVYGSNSSDFNGYQLEITAKERFKAPLFSDLAGVGFIDSSIDTNYLLSELLEILTDGTGNRLTYA